MGEKVRILLIGAGRMGQLRCPMIYANPRARLVGVVDPYEPAGRKLAECYDATYYESIEKVDLATCDALWISTGTFNHEELILAAATYKLACFCEKPIHGDPAKIEYLFTECAKANVPLCCGFQRRFDQSYINAYNAVASGKIGTPTMVRVAFVDHPCPPLEFLKNGGDPFLDLAPHDVDFVRWLLQDEPESVFASGSSSIPELAEANVYDNAMITLKFRKGTICQMMFSRGGTYGYDQRCEIYGTEGMVSVENLHADGAVLSTVEGIRSSKYMHSFPQRFHDAFKAEVESFVSVVLDGVEWQISYPDCIAAQNISIAASASCAEGVVVPYQPHDLFRIRPIGKGSFGSYICNIMQRISANEKFALLPAFTRSLQQMSFEQDVTGSSLVDAVYICSPDVFHQPQAIACLEAGKHVLVEKPITPSFETLQSTWKRHSDQTLMVGFHRRYEAAFIAAKQFSNANQAVSSILIESFDPVPADPDMKFVVYNSLSHDIDMVCWLFPDFCSFETKDVFAEPKNSEIRVNAVLTRSNGSLVQVQIRYKKAYPSYVQRVTLDNEHVFQTKEICPENEKDPNFCKVYQDAYLDQWRAFVQFCKGGESKDDAAKRVESYAKTFRILDQICEAMDK
uniref:Gfo/Idh/MocA-like oxidoreductase N-terminal domain-containing protein n=1 Tax=Mucochytrium quahogii TaxID=96639 RepID=A0A7S2S5G1_9STRA|mmetsp:Transcript_6762/g.10697  ORF Transcript_6762/g.10697 Transcript_6762/m.10697 type:complete len:626 (-) Transcript_6762:39-1916(-)